MAREYVIELPADGAPPKLLPDLEELVGISALADGCLMAATQAGEQQTTAHYSIRAQQALVHTSPRERVHRLERLPSSGAIVDRLVDGIAPHATCAVPLAFSIEAEALGTAIDLANDGQAEAAAAALLEAGAPPEAADALRTRLGSRIARHALIAVRKLQSIHPLADSAAIIHGAQEDWFTEDDTTREGYVRVSTVDASVIRTRLDTLVASIMPTIA
jgi:hypothetical protein